MGWPKRKTPRLPFFRISEAGGDYFITLVTKNRERVLLTPAAGRTVTDTFRMLGVAGDIDLHAATIMPDHVHFLFTLCDRLSISQVLGKFKSLARDQGLAAWRWQKNGFEHQVRPSESLEDYAFYIFMNPYRAGLCPLSSRPLKTCLEEMTGKESA